MTPLHWSWRVLLKLKIWGCRRPNRQNPLHFKAISDNRSARDQARVGFRDHVSGTGEIPAGAEPIKSRFVACP
jgi:hypothetical protein